MQSQLHPEGYSVSEDGLNTPSKQNLFDQAAKGEGSPCSQKTHKLDGSLDTIFTPKQGEASAFTTCISCSRRS